MFPVFQEIFSDKLLTFFLNRLHLIDQSGTDISMPGDRGRLKKYTLTAYETKLNDCVMWCGKKNMYCNFFSAKPENNNTAVLHSAAG